MEQMEMDREEFDPHNDLFDQFWGSLNDQQRAELATIEEDQELPGWVVPTSTAIGPSFGEHFFPGLESGQNPTMSDLMARHIAGRVGPA